MSAPNLPPVNVPTLTEVVDWSTAETSSESGRAPHVAEQFPDLSDEIPLSECHQPVDIGPAFEPAAVDAVGESELIQRICERVQCEVDLMLDERLAPVMKAVLDRAVEELLAHARGELAVTLRGIVAQAVLDERSSSSRSADATPAV